MLRKKNAFQQLRSGITWFLSTWTNTVPAAGGKLTEIIKINTLHTAHIVVTCMGTGKKVFNKCQLNSWWHSPCILEAAQKTSASSWALYGWERIALCPLPVFSPLSHLPLATPHVFRHRSCGYCKIRTPHPLVTYLHLHFPNTSWDTTLIFCCFPRRENVKV